MHAHYKSMLNFHSCVFDKDVPQTTEAKSGHHVSCSDFTFTDHSSRFAFMFAFTFTVHISSSPSGSSSRDAGTTCAPPSIPRASETWLHGQATARTRKTQCALCTSWTQEILMYLTKAHNTDIGLHKVSCGLGYSVQFLQ